MPYIAIKAYPKDEETKKRTVDWKEQVEIPEIEPNMDKMMIVSGEKKYE